MPHFFHRSGLLDRTVGAACLIFALGAGCAHDAGIGGPAPTPAAPTEAQVVELRTQTKLRAALAGAHRSEKNRKRDVWRHPAETLGFFGLRDDMTVVELWPGGGWYTEVLAPVLAERGQLIVTSADPNGDPNDYSVKGAKMLQALLQSNAAIFGKVKTTIVAPPAQLQLGKPGSADLVVTFRNLHGWMEMGDEAAAKIIRAAFDVLKPGGVFGIVEHRGKAGSDFKTGYVDEEFAIKLIEGVGFKLQARSEINANPKDTKDHENGVWALPPTLRNGDKDRAKYEAIGESDRFTLRFAKP